MSQPPVAAGAPKPLKSIHAKLEGIDGDEPEARNRQDDTMKSMVIFTF